MSDNNPTSTEYLKRTCLVCGCHTNLTINIYEPRAGPNIIELIQAKFKLQPLNDDKYLCFSCNNWLVNWHSVKSVTSTDTESASNMSNNQGGSPQNTSDKRSPNNQNNKKKRPVAQVRPRQLLATRTQQQQSTANDAPTSHSPIANYSKRHFRGTVSASLLRHGLNEHKMLRNCNICGCAIVLRVNGTANSHKLSSLKRSRSVQCRKCRDIANWCTLQMKSLAKIVQKGPALSRNSNNSASSSSCDRSHQSTQNSQQNLSSNQRYQQPRIDGKVVAMFRRLGTTLSREGQPGTHSVNAPPIMSPTKQRPRWTRSLEEDEILLEFDSAITEVLPAATGTINASEATQVRRRLSYDSHQSGAAPSSHNETEVTVRQTLQNFRLPQGLSISLV